jgi:hypothetical protein
VSWKRRCVGDCLKCCCSGGSCSVPQQQHSPSCEALATSACRLSGQVRALTLGRPHRDALKELMNKKEIVGDLLNQLRCAHSPSASWQLRSHAHLHLTDGSKGVQCVVHLPASGAADSWHVRALQAHQATGSIRRHASRHQPQQDQHDAGAAAGAFRPFGPDNWWVFIYCIHVTHVPLQRFMGVLLP